MKKQRYIVEIEMPDGDFISAGWLKDLIQTDCDVEDEGGEKITVRVQETSLPSNLDDAAEDCIQGLIPEAELPATTPFALEYVIEMLYKTFKAGAEWMAGQGETVEGYIAGTNKVAAILAIPRKEHNKGDKVVVQIRKKQ